MTLEKLVVPYILCGALQQRGYPQFDSNFYWVVQKDTMVEGEAPLPMVAYFEFVEAEKDRYHVLAAAPTASELAARVPYQYFVLRDLKGYLPYKKSAIEAGGITQLGDVMHSEQLAEAYARAILYAVMEDGYEMPEAKGGKSE